MFAGVPGLAATLLCAIAFALFTWQVLANGPLRRWDEAAGDALRAAPPPREAAELLADLGNLSVALPLLALAMALTLRHSRGRDWWPVLCYALAMGVMAPLVTGLKAWVDRTGPLGGGGFFPSGHAATTAVALGAAALLLTEQAPRPRRTRRMGRRRDPDGGQRAGARMARVSLAAGCGGELVSRGAAAGGGRRSRPPWLPAVRPGSHPSLNPLAPPSSSW